MEEPPSYSLQDSLSSPGLYALGFTFFMLFILMILSAIMEGIVLKSKNTSVDKPTHSDSPHAKLIREHIRLYSTTWLVFELFTLLCLLGISIAAIRYYLFWDNPVTALFCTLLSVVVLGGILKTMAKVFVSDHFDQSLKLFSRILKTIVTIFKPVTIPLMDLDSRLSKTINQPDQQREELSNALERAVKDEVDSEKKEEILRGIVTFSTLRVKQVMHSRAEIAALNIGLNFHELLQKINTFGFSRIPVFKNLTDQLEGVLYTKDLLPFLDKDTSFQWQKLLRPGFFVHENKKLDSLLKEFQEKRIHLALVLNDHKRVTGIITMEDVIEEIIGDINDEFDEVTSK